MTSLPQSIALHLGAHKTASTHLQRSLAAASLPGVRVIGPPKLRGRGQTLPERFGFPLDEGRSPQTPVDVSTVLEGLSDGAQRLVISDENFAGKLQTGWGRVPTPVYPTAQTRLTALAGAIHQATGHKPDAFLAIRNPVDYLGSIYSQVLHGGRRVRPEAFMDKNDPAAIDWADYVQRLRAAGEVGPVTVWRYEDYGPLFDTIASAMTGQHGVRPLPERIQPRLSHAALDALLQAKEAQVRLKAGEAARAFPVSAEHPALVLYDAKTQAAASAGYDQQWARLLQMPGITCLVPE